MNKVNLYDVLVDEENFDVVLHLVRVRLADADCHLSKASVLNEHGETVELFPGVFSDEELAAHIFYALDDLSLQLDDVSCKTHTSLVVLGAVVEALRSKALIERGREHSMKDNGVQYTPPDVSTMLMDQAHACQHEYFQKVDFLKNLND